MKKRKNKIPIVIYIIIIVYAISFVVVFGRYVLEVAKQNLAKSQELYFYSDKLQSDEAKYNVKWDGSTSYQLSISLNTKENELLASADDVKFEMSSECSSNVKCSFNKEKGTISKDKHSEDVIATITPNSSDFSSQKTATVKIKATTKDSFEKELSATFTFFIEEQKVVETKIEDEKNRDYLTVNISNKHNEKKKIQIEFPKNEFVIDTTNDVFLEKSKYQDVEYKESGSNYVLSFVMPGISTFKIKYFKNSPSQDYTDTDKIKITVSDVKS